MFRSDVHFLLYFTETMTVTRRNSYNHHSIQVRYVSVIMSVIKGHIMHNDVRYCKLATLHDRHGCF